MNEIRFFTIEEANSKIAWLNDLFARLYQKRDDILHLEAEIDAMELISEKTKNETTPVIQQKVESYTVEVSGFYSLIDEMQQAGCLLKDLEQGLIDFYSLQAGRPVFLCWKQGEEQVRFWHEVGEGFSGRQPLPCQHGEDHEKTN